MRLNELLELGRRAYDRQQATWSGITSAADEEVLAMQREQNQHTAEMFGADTRHPEDVRAEARRQQDRLDRQGREAFARRCAETVNSQRTS